MNEEIKITEDLRRLGDICSMVGYLSALADNVAADNYADNIVGYITELFNTKRGDEDDYGDTRSVFEKHTSRLFIFL